jgi:hypothetical protein
MTCYSYNSDTTTSYCPFFLLKKGKTSVNFLDANLIQVNPECGPPVSWHFWPKCVLSEVIKECVKKDARDWSSLTNLCPTRGVAPCHWLVGVTPSRNKGCTPFLESWT